MPETLELLDQAIELGRKELKYLEIGDVMKAQDICGERDRLTQEALNNNDHEQRSDVILKVDMLRELQENITAEARKLHALLKSDILKVRKKTKVFSAYNGTVRRSGISANRYVNKTG